MRTLPDVQQTSTTGFSKREIQKVGVRHIKLPLWLVGQEHPVIASFSAYCDLDKEHKGINMSRMAQTLYEASSNEPTSSLKSYAIALKHANKARRVYVKASFDFVEKSITPVTGKAVVETVPVLLETILDERDIETTYVQIAYTGMSLCPCSKEMSLLVNNATESELNEIDGLSSALAQKIRMAGFGAHNQKSHVEIKVAPTTERLDDLIHVILDLIAVAERSVSIPASSMLKRPDEKYLTEASYMGAYVDESLELVHVTGAGPKFVEDIARQAADALDEMSYYSDYVVVVNNDESIHSNDMVATAVLSKGRVLK